MADISREAPEKNRIPTLYRVTKAHKPESSQPLSVLRGERLYYERRLTSWAGWLWCWQPGGHAGWVPEAWVAIEGTECVLQRDYDATELRVQPGESLHGLLVEAGWLQARRATGETGWVPLDCVVVEPGL